MTASVTVVDEVHRRVSRRGPDGSEIEVLAARRGVSMRPSSAATSSLGPSDLNPLSLVISFVVSLVASIVIDTVLGLAAEGRPWKVRVYRVRKFAPPRLHKEVLPRGVEPEDRMLELLDQFAPPPSSS